MNLTTLKKLENPLQGVSIACVLAAKLRVGSLRKNKAQIAKYLFEIATSYNVCYIYCIQFANLLPIISGFCYRLAFAKYEDFI